MPAGRPGISSGFACACDLPRIGDGQRAKQDAMDIQLQPSGWDAEVRQLIGREAYTKEQAIEAVTLRYLCAGDCRPLLNSVLRDHIHTAELMAQLAAMFDPKYRAGHSANPVYGFGFKPTRRRGRPKHIQSLDLADAILFALNAGAQRLTQGNDPGQEFWSRPRVARQMLGGCGLERLCAMLNSGELESFRDGHARLITVASIESYVARRLAEAGGTPAMSPAATPPRRRKQKQRQRRGLSQGSSVDRGDAQPSGDSHG
jgi:hypothetical protein